MHAERIMEELYLTTNPELSDSNLHCFLNQPDILGHDVMG